MGKVASHAEQQRRCVSGAGDLEKAVEDFKRAPEIDQAIAPGSKETAAVLPPEGFGLGGFGASGRSDEGGFQELQEFRPRRASSSLMGASSAATRHVTAAFCALRAAFSFLSARFSTRSSSWCGMVSGSAGHPSCRQTRPRTGVRKCPAPGNVS